MTKTLTPVHLFNHFGNSVMTEKYLSEQVDILSDLLEQERARSEKLIRRLRLMAGDTDEDEELEELLH